VDKIVILMFKQVKFTVSTVSRKLKKKCVPSHDDSCKENGKKSVKRIGEYLSKIYEKRNRQINIFRTNNLQRNENICLIYTNY